MENTKKTKIAKIVKTAKTVKTTKITKIIEKIDTKTNSTFVSLVKKIAIALDDKKASDIIILDVRGKSDITDFFVLATGNSTTHIRSLPSFVNYEMAKNNITPLRREGIIKETKWSVLDYGFAIIHIFTKEMRAEYNIEAIWGDAKKVNWEEKTIAKK